MERDPSETFRVIVIHPDTQDILVSREHSRLNLPAFEVPRRIRQAEAITTRLRALVELDTYCLFVLPDERSPLMAWNYVVTSLSRYSPPAFLRFEWLAVDSLALEALQDGPDWFALKHAFEQIERYKQDRSQGFFGCPGWLTEITNWAQHAVEPLGMHLTGTHQHLNASPSSCLLRLVTDDSALWFKAANEPVVRELSITRYLTRHFRAFLPEMIAEHDDSQGWLSKEVPGVHPGHTSPDETWIAASSALAELQIASMGHTLHLADAGCCDVRAWALFDMIDPFFDAITSLMEVQSRLSPPPMSRTQLCELKDILADAILCVEKLDIPASLGHLDLNTGNILVSEDRVVFLDWASGCIGSPFLGLEYLLEQLRILRPSEQNLHRNVQNAYTRKWQAFVDKREMSVAVGTNPLLAAFCYAAGSRAWRDPSRLRDPNTAGHLRSLSRRMKKEAEIWVSDRRPHSSCPQIK